jgi:hypothetical protein
MEGAAPYPIAEWQSRLMNHYRASTFDRLFRIFPLERAGKYRQRAEEGCREAQDADSKVRQSCKNLAEHWEHLAAHVAEQASRGDQASRETEQFNGSESRVSPGI